MSNTTTNLVTVFKNLKKAATYMHTSNNDTVCCCPSAYWNDSQGFVLDAINALANVSEKVHLKRLVAAILNYTVVVDNRKAENRTLMEVLLQDAINCTSVEIIKEIAEYPLQGHLFEEPDSIIRIWFDDDLTKAYSTQTRVGEFPIFPPDGKCPMFWFKKSEEGAYGEDYRFQCLIFTYQKKNWIFWGDNFKFSSFDELEDIPPYFVPYFIEGHNKLSMDPLPEPMKKVLAFMQEKKAEGKNLVKNEEISVILK